MTNGSLYRYYVATVVTLWFVTVITLATELVPALKEFVASVFLHHWLGKSILMLLVFGLVAVATPPRRFDERQWAYYVLVSAVAGGLLILGYFGVHYVTT